ncbi:MAG: 1-deoxy-D-xylulose-5-phosphate synthase, partial [Muribaculaceae bacterium]|nr:1-deoxy-D-xylulose-5-phosphate synthase [Muribaculaceae bacterium]
DQVSQDVAINNMPAVFNVFFGSVYGTTDQTHLGFFDISMLTGIPRLNFLAPTCREEYLAMLDWAIAQTAQPVVVRVPGGAVKSDPSREILADYSKPVYEIARKGSRVALIGAGTFFSNMSEAADILAAEGIDATLINPRGLSTLDTATLDSLADYDIVITAEDGTADGGFGQRVAAYLSPKGTRVRVLGLPKDFPNGFKAQDMLTACHLQPAQIATIAREAMK